MYTTARHRSLSWARWIQSTNSHPIFLQSIIIISFNLRLCPSNILFLSGSPTKILSTSLSSHACYMTHPSTLFQHLNRFWKILDDHFFHHFPRSRERLWTVYAIHKYLTFFIAYPPSISVGKNCTNVTCILS